MNEPDLLAQRFVDNDLSAEERLQLLQALDRDAVLRRRVLNLQTLVAASHNLPRLTPASRFSAQVLDQLEVRRPHPVERLKHFFCAPRVFQWNMAGAMAVCCATLVLVWGLGSSVLAPRPASVASGQHTQESPVFVRVLLLQPQAASVSIAGDFNGWDPDATQLERIEGGAWTTTIPFKPGRYQYMYVIDGQQWVPDPLATEVSLDGFGSQNAVLNVEAPL